MNDPNGLIYLDGEFHLFYQYYPYGLNWGTMHWGHAVSKDLLHWEHLLIALYPDSMGTIFSGSVVADTGNTSGLAQGTNKLLVAIFTHFKYGLQRQSLAYSNDNGRNWLKFNANPVIKNPFRIHFRDPKVFMHVQSKKWAMVLACGDHIRIYNSPDLLKWEYTGKFGSHSGAHGSVWECPDLFEIEVVNEPGVKKWVMLVSIKNSAPNGGSGTQYFTGSFNGREFVSDHLPSKVLWLDYGKDNYAGITWNNIPGQDGRRIFTAWMNNWQYAGSLLTSPWRGAMTVPRELSLEKKENEYLLISKPVREVQSLRKKIRGEENVFTDKVFVIERPEQFIVNSFEIEAVIDFSDIRELFFEFVDADGSPCLITLNKIKRTLLFMRRCEGPDKFKAKFNGEFIAPVSFEKGRMKIQILIDNCSVEIFIDEGVSCMTNLIFPSGRINRVYISSSAKKLQLESLNYYELMI